MPNVTKRPTRDDLMRATQAAQQAARASATASEVVLAALDGEGQTQQDSAPTRASTPAPNYRVRGTRDWKGTPSVGRTPTQEKEAPAFEEFMAAIEPALKRGGAAITISDNRGWMKIESKSNGHKIYIAKSKNTLSRIESTLPIAAIEGAWEPERPNGLITSRLPVEVTKVVQAIELLISSKEGPRPIVRAARSAQVFNEQGTPQQRRR